ncbi:hypothetical protein [Bacillus luti]|uniref:hypothetical protein n=1 Tax=Bacillus luti TaxID=2026191 RepID=UPI00289BD6CF|nr:hypothetical protein [Bacillus luti]
MKSYNVDFQVNGVVSSRVINASNKRLAEEQLIKELIKEGYAKGQTLRVAIAK